MKSTAAVLLSLVAFALPAYCMVTVSPEIQVIGYSPGRAAKCRITVTNVGKSSADIQVQPEDWSKAGSNSGKTGWLSANPSKFRIGAGKTKTIKVKALINDTTSQYHVTQVFFSSIERDAAPLNIGTRVGSLIKWEMKEKK